MPPTVTVPPHIAQPGVVAILVKNAIWHKGRDQQGEPQNKQGRRPATYLGRSVGSRQGGAATREALTYCQRRQGGTRE
jgi:hypothetical protein